MLIFIPIFYTIQTLLVGIFTDQWWIWVAYLISIYPMGRLAIAWYIRLKKTMRGGWYNTQLRKSSGKVLELVSLRNEIIEETKNLIGKK